MENERSHREKQHSEMGRPRVHLQVSCRRDFGYKGAMVACVLVVYALEYQCMNQVFEGAFSNILQFRK